MKRVPKSRGNKIIRIGRYLIDKRLLDEGYLVGDIFELGNLIELPEAVDPDSARHVCWMLCPCCEEKSQVDGRNPECAECGWSPREEAQNAESLRCAA